MEDLEGWELVPGHDDSGKKLPPTAGSLKNSYLLCSSTTISQFADFAHKDDNLMSLEAETPPIEKIKEDPLTLSAGGMEAHQDPSFHKNMEETKFVDMKSLEGEEQEEDEAPLVMKSVGDEEEEEEESAGGMDIWKWSLTGIGALCSFGVATVCIVVLGGSKDGGFKQEENQRLKEVVVKHVHATKWNEAISAVRGGSVPLTRAHITFGGYYDARL